MPTRRAGGGGGGGGVSEGEQTRPHPHVYAPAPAHEPCTQRPAQHTPAGVQLGREPHTTGKGSRCPVPRVAFAGV